MATISTKRKIILLDISTKINRQMMSKERTARKHLQGRGLTPVKMMKNPKKSRGNAANKKANASANENGTKKRNTNDDVEEKKYKS